MALVDLHYQGGAGGYPGQLIYNPVVPFLHNLGGLYHGKRIFISGIHSNRFTISLQCGSLTNDKIAMQFDVKGVDTILRNTHQNKKGWRVAPYFPFSPDKFFDMMILVEEHVFKVAVNNQQLLEYSNCGNCGYKMNRVDTLRITGDLRLTQVWFQ